MRRQDRIAVMKILYRYDFEGLTSQEIAVQSTDELVDNEFQQQLLNEYIEKMDQVDEIIKSSLTNYTIDRLNYVDRAIIRLAVTELLNSTSKEVVINEALEITKLYSDNGDHKATSFNNRLLDTIANKLGC